MTTMVPQTDLEWAVKGHGERIRHQEQDDTPPGLNPKRSGKGDGLFPKQYGATVSEADSEAYQR